MFDLTTLVSAPALAAWNGPHWWFLFFPLLWLAVIVGVIFLFRRRSWGPGCGRGPGGPRYEGPLSATDVLERRFAEGELTAEEFRHRRSVLEGPSPSPHDDQ